MKAPRACAGFQFFFNWGIPLSPALCYNWADKGGYFKKLSQDFETSDMTFEWLGEIFEGDSADMCAEREGDPGAWTPTCVSGNFILYLLISTPTTLSGGNIYTTAVRTSVGLSQLWLCMDRLSDIHCELGILSFSDSRPSTCWFW